MDLTTLTTMFGNALDVATPYVLGSIPVLAVAILIWRIKTPILRPVPAKTKAPEQEVETTV